MRGRFSVSAVIRFDGIGLLSGQEANALAAGRVDRSADSRAVERPTRSPPLASCRQLEPPRYTEWRDLVIWTVSLRGAVFPGLARGERENGNALGKMIDLFFPIQVDEVIQ
jgi:hypothetical protein